MISVMYVAATTRHVQMSVVFQMEATLRVQMSVVFQMATTHHVQIVRELQTVMQQKICVAAVIQTFNVDPVNPPAGVTFNAAGTQITISSGVINAGWIGIADAGVQVTTVDLLTADSPGGSVAPIRGVQTQP